MSTNREKDHTRPSGGEPTSSVRQEVGAIQSAVENVTQNYLETLDALSTVYEAAAGLSQLFDSSSIAYFTLRRVLESLDVECGAIFLEVDGALKFQYDSEDALSLLKESGIEDASLEGRPLFCNGSDASPYLQPEAGNRNLLLAPVVAVQRRLGIVVALSDQERKFTTKDLKLVSAVTSQAAIALSGAKHFDQILIERQKLRSVIENNAGGIVVLAPDGRTILTNAAARGLLGFPEDRPEGFSFVDELGHWKFSRDPECMLGEGPQELSFEMGVGHGLQARVLTVSGRRVHGTDGAPASIVLNLKDSTEERRGERCKERLLSLVSLALRSPIAGMQEALSSCEGAADQRQPGCVQRMGSQLQDLLALSERLQSYVRVLEGSAAGDGRVDLARVGAEVREQVVERYAERAARIELDVDSAASMVAIAEEPTRILLENLLCKAVEFGPGQQPEVRVSTRRAGEDWIELSVEDHLQETLARVQRLCVEDPDACQEEVSDETMGLVTRLALVHEIVHRCAGKLELRAASHEGTLLSVTLPAAAGSEPSPGRPTGGWDPGRAARGDA